MFFKRLTGVHGSVTIPSIGVTIGTIGSWTLARREDSPPGIGEWDLRAVFSYFNEFAWNSSGWEKRITTITFWATGMRYRVCADCIKPYRGEILKPDKEDL